MDIARQCKTNTDNGFSSSLEDKLNFRFIGKKRKRKEKKKATTTTTRVCKQRRRIAGLKELRSYYL